MSKAKVGFIINAPLGGSASMVAKTRDGLLVAVGFTRIVVGDRGPYVEFLEGQVAMCNLRIPQEEAWRMDSETAYYTELRSKCRAHVMVYLQRRRVAYADYVPGMFYISPFELVMPDGRPFATRIEQLELV